jgi:hypothetical protein
LNNGDICEIYGLIHRHILTLYLSFQDVSTKDRFDKEAAYFDGFEVGFGVREVLRIEGERAPFVLLHPEAI